MLKNTISLLLLIFIAFITHHRWFSFETFSSGDWWYAFPETLKEYLFISVWNSQYGFGNFDIVFWRFPIFNIPYGTLASIGFGQEVSEKLFIFWPTIILGNIFSFLLFKKITSSNIGAFIGALIFNYNTYYLIIGGGFLIYSAASWVLLTLLIFMIALERRYIYFFVLAGITLFLGSSYDFRIGYIGVFLLLFYSIYYFSVIDSKKISVSSLVEIISPLTVLIVFVLLHTYWILPTVKVGALTSNVVLDRILFGNEFLNILYSFSFYHPFWTGEFPAIFHNQPIPLYFWAIPIFAILGLITTRNKNVVFFGLVAIIGVFLTKQVSQPVSSVYPWLFEYFPGFSAFREASKFYFLIALGYGVLIAAFVSWLWQNWTRNNVQKYGRYVLIIFIAGVFLWNTKPFFTGEIGTMYLSRTIPKDYLIFKSFILRQDSYFRTLWIPISQRWSINTTKHPSLSGIDIHLQWERFFDKQKILETEGEFQIRMMENDLSNRLLDLASVKYVIVPLQEEKIDDFFLNYGKKRVAYFEILDKVEYLTKIDAGTEDLVVYENKDFHPHIYATEQQETVKNVKSIITDVRYTMINPAEYRFFVEHATKPFYLNFSETYHPQWQIRVGSFSWVDRLISKTYFVNTTHIKTDAGFNSFYIDPQKVCEKFMCIKNADGSFDIVGTLYFKPQSYLYVGFIISGVTAIVILCWGFIMLKKKFYGKKL